MVSRIGVNVTTSVMAAPVNSGPRSGRFQIAGVTATGPAGGARVVRSLAEYGSVFGTRTAYASPMYDAAALFFSEGGSELVVTRVVGSGATSAAVALRDRASVPVDALRVESVEPGATAMTVTVADDGDAAFSLTVSRNGSTVESWRGLTSPADAVDAASGSGYVRITSLGAATAGAAARPAAGAFELVGGTDDRASVTVTTIADTLRDAPDEAPGGALAVPGYPGDIIADHLTPIAVAHRQVLLLSTSQAATPDEAAAMGRSLRGRENGDHVGLFYPWVTVQDGARRRAVDPVSYVAAVRARAHVGGYWRVPAGEQSRATAVVGTVTPVSVAVNDELAADCVNGIVTMYGTIRLYGWQSLSADVENLGLLSARDTLNNLSIAVTAVLEPHVFEVMDGRGFLRSKVAADVEGVLFPIAEAGALFARVNSDGETLDPGYSVAVDSTGNTAETMARNELQVLVQVRLSPLAQLINVEIVKVPLTAAL